MSSTSSDLVLAGLAKRFGDAVAVAGIELTVAGGAYSWVYTLNDNAPHTGTGAVGSADQFPEEAFSVVVTDSDDPASLAALVARTRLVLTTVGPYQLYGSALVKACAESGVDYVDLCGEPAWMRQKIDAHDAAAGDERSRRAGRGSDDGAGEERGQACEEGVAATEPVADASSGEEQPAE